MLRNYLTIAIRNLFRHSTGHVETTGELPTLMLSICNSRYTGGAMCMAPAARIDDGRLDVLRVQPEGDVDVAPFVTVTFDEPMVPLATLDAAPEARATFGVGDGAALVVIDFVVVVG